MIGIGCRRLKEISINEIKNIQREQVETNLEFLGLIVMENRLKPQSMPVIQCLKEANIRTIMCTGDNLLTAVSVAHDSDMVYDDEKVIIVEANSGEELKFAYAENTKKKVCEIEFEKTVSADRYMNLLKEFI